MTTGWIIGLASGSSADGVDAALLETEGIGLDLRVQVTHAREFHAVNDQLILTLIAVDSEITGCNDFVAVLEGWQRNRLALPRDAREHIAAFFEIEVHAPGLVFSKVGDFATNGQRALASCKSGSAR